MSLAGLLVFGTVIDVLRPLVDQKEQKLYAISSVAEKLLVPKQHSYSELVEETREAFEYNTGYSPGGDVAGQSSSPRFSASVYKDPNEGIELYDAVSQLGITLKPLYELGDPRIDGNRVVYPLFDETNGVAVVTLGATGFKEDIIVNSFVSEELFYKYELVMPDGVEARIEIDGSLAFYGVESALLGNVATTTPEDALVLEKARENSEKNTLLFKSPAPVVLEGRRAQSGAFAKYSLEGTTLTLHAYDLDDANYPISIDPSIYVDSAQRFMRGNNETNIDFDLDNELIQKSQTTGARIDEWTATSGLDTPLFDSSAVAAGGYVYYVGGETGAGAPTTVGYSSSGTFTVPAGITSVTVEAWGGGGGGAATNNTEDGGDGGGGGYATATITTTPSETLTIVVGGGGGGGTRQPIYTGGGGGGGGYSAVRRSSTDLIVAPGGGGGGGGGDDQVGGDGAPGGTATAGNTGGASDGANGGSGATTGPDAGGAGGTGGAVNNGTAGGLLSGGDGGNGSNTAGTGDANNGGTSGGGDGGFDSDGTDYASGGGGGAGYYGGGGGAGSDASSGNGSGGGGGGSGTAYLTGTGTSSEAGSGRTPGASADPDRSGAADGGLGATNDGDGTSGDDGRIVITYTLGGTAATTDTVYWTSFNSATLALESPNPGDGVCTGWCNETVYNLPEERRGHSTVAYNGYLYAIGGVDASDNRESTVFISKLGANGEPSLWHPTDTNKANWDYWFTDTGLSSERSYLAATTYNNRMYILGGQTDATPGGVTTVEVADILPNGKLSSWSTTGMEVLPSGAGTHMHGVQIYNGTLYTIGGFEGVDTSTSNLRNSVYFSKLNSDGTMNAWQATDDSFATARASFGGSYTAIWGAYIYIGGGCSGVNASGYCTSLADDVQIASINADGSLNNWATIDDLSNSRIGYSFIAWQDGLYRFGGCTAQNATTGDCNGTLASVDYGVINPPGEVSTVNEAVPTGTGSCNGSNPVNCDLPDSGDGAGEGGQMLSASVILNGYLYVIGGCTNLGCSASSGNVSYTSVSSDGSLARPDNCVANGNTLAENSGSGGGGAWCVDSTNSVNGTSGISAAGVTTFNNRIYLIGGIDETGNGTQNIYYNSANIDGSLSGSWTATSFTAAGITTGGDETGEKAYTYAYARANPSSTTQPGNLYIIGGCKAISASAGCSGQYNTSVYKCNIAVAGGISSCSTSGQLQLDVELGTESNEGLGLHSGTVYANYIYLIGGFSDGVGDRDTVFYARFDDSNNIVDAESGTAILANDDDDWIESDETLSVGRRRGWAFGYNGHIYAVGGYDDTGTGVIPFIEWSKENVSDGSIEPFVTSSVEITQRWGLSMVVSNSFAYVIGGCSVGASPSNCTSFEPSVETFQLYNNDSGSVDDFTEQADQTFSTATDRWGASSVIKDGYIYVAGGCTSTTDCTTVTDSVQYAPISTADGTVGTWAALDSLPAGRAWGYLGVAGGDLYYVGGQDGAGLEHDDVYYITPNPSGGSSTTVEHFSARRTSEQSKTTSGWSDVVGSADSGTVGSTNGWVDSSNLTAGEDYLVMVWASHNGSSASQRSGVRVKHGATTFDESEATEEIDRTSTLYKTPYFWFTVWTAVSGEDLEVEFYGSSTTTSRVEDVTMLVMNAEDLVADGDLQYDIDTTGGTLDTTFTPKATVTWTPATASDNWWTMGYVRGDTVGVGNDQLEYRLDIDSGTIRSTASVEGEDANDTPLYGIGWVEPYSAASHTVELEVRESAADMQWNAAGLFSLNLDRFEGFAEYSDPGDGTAMTAVNTFVEQGNIDPVISTTGNVIIAAGGIADDNNRRMTSQLQVGGSSVTDVVGGWQQNTNDKVPITLSDMQINVPPSTLDIDFDVRYTTGTGTQHVEDRWMVAFTMLEAGTGGSGSWSTATNGLPTGGERAHFGGAVWNDRIYIMGGTDTSNAETSTVFVSPQLTNGGDIASAWTSSTGFDVARTGNAAIAYANNLYVFGGYDGTNYLSDVQFASIGYKVGTINQTGQNITVASGSPTFTTDMIGTTLQYRDGQIATITAVPTSTTLTVDVSKTVSDVGYTIQDGSVGDWTYTTSMPGPLRDARAVAANGYIYLVGGRSADDVCRPKTVIAPINANTTIVTGNNPTGIGEWYETNVRYGGGRYGAAVSYADGRLYTMGGGCESPIGPSYSTGTIAQTTVNVTGTGTNWTDDYIGTTITYQDFSTATIIAVNSATSLTVDVSKTVTAGETYSIDPVRHYESTLNSQPQVAQYSRLIDTDTDVFPNGFLLNGLDNSIGARWRVNYRSMHDLDTEVSPAEDCGTTESMATMTTYGRDTDFGDVTLGDVSPYVALNDSGGDINCARYFYFFVSIDASQTFGYPEDVNRGPTIADLSLFFTSDPNKRLRHGKTFTGGEQQPLDSPCGQSVDANCPPP